MKHRAAAQPEAHPDLRQAGGGPPRAEGAQAALLLQRARARRVRVIRDQVRGVPEGHNGVADELACRTRSGIRSHARRHADSESEISLVQETQGDAYIWVPLRLDIRDIFGYFDLDKVPNFIGDRVMLSDTLQGL